jgi:hypothetical protein
MVRLVGQDVTGACKAKAQSGALLRVGGAVVLFLFVVFVIKNHVEKSRKSVILLQRRGEKFKPRKLARKIGCVIIVGIEY